MTTKDDFRTEIVQVLNQVSKTPLPKNKYFKAIGLDKYVSFPNEIAQQYHRCIRILREKTSNSGKLVSDEALKKKLDAFIVKLKYTDDQEKIKKEIDKHIVAFFNDIKNMKSTKYLFLIPIMNLQLYENLEIGDSMLVNFDAKVLSSLSSIYSLNFNFDGKILPNIVEELPRYNETHTFAVVVAEAPDKTKALEIATQKTETCLSVLRMYYYNPSVLLRNEYKKCLATSLVQINLDQKTYGERSTAANICNHFPTKVEKNQIDEIKKVDLPIINRILSRKTEDLTPLQEDLLTAILWFGNATKDEQRNMRFVKSIMALEALLVPDGGKEKRNLIAKRFASITYSLGTDSEKKEAFLEMRNMYQLRNSIIHSGEGYVYEDDAIQLMIWVRATMQLILQDAEKFNTLNELIKKEYPINEKLYEKLEERKASPSKRLLRTLKKLFEH